VVEVSKRRLPDWLRRKLPVLSSENTNGILSRERLNTVCESALCPNRSECYSRNTATFMILGNICTRSCGFCAIDVGKPQQVEADEPERVARAAKDLRLQYVVITSVARDELADEGAGHFAKTVLAVRHEIENVQVEVLTPDFHARRELIAMIVEAGPTVYNHNLESVERLQRMIRPQASYERSLKVIETIKSLNPEMTTKSGMMLGLGETRKEILAAARDLAHAGCDILTLGQYLSPSKEHLPVVDFISPDEFKSLADEIKPFGFREVFAGPYVRSSYHAGETFLNAVSESKS
jgi:lipoyl synthase